MSLLFGVLEPYVIGRNQPWEENLSIEVLQFMQDKKDQNPKLIMERVAEGHIRVRFSANFSLVKPMERVAEGPIEVRFSANLSSVKPKARIDCSNIDSDERIDIYANSDMKPVM